MLDPVWFVLAFLGTLAVCYWLGGIMDRIKKGR